jgi:hypothetical protein
MLLLQKNSPFVFYFFYLDSLLVAGDSDDSDVAQTKIKQPLVD